jgi:hypothetical protein
MCFLFVTYFIIMYSICAHFVHIVKIKYFLCTKKETEIKLKQLIFNLFFSSG